MTVCERVALGALGLAVGACRPSASVSPPGGESAHAPAQASATASTASSASARTPADSSETVQQVAPSRAPANRFGETPFPPPDIPPPHERSAEPGDGVWRALGAPGERARSEPPLMMTTVIHPHKVSKWAKLIVAVMDQSRLEIRYMPGQSDVEEIAKLTGTKLDGVPSGRVPEERLDRLLAVFNGGFKPRHGRWGMKSSDRVLLEPREEGCTVAVDATATVSVADWSSLSGRADELIQFRQTPPCLVVAGRLHEKLDAFDERPWGGFDPKRKTRRRSALGVDPSGRWLFYAIGEEMGPRVLAQGMSYIGAEFAAELDINWSWTRFLLFSETEAEPGLLVTSTLIPKMVHRDRQYVSKPAARGFFYVTTR